MNVSVNWTAVSSICTAVSCIVALSLGVWNIVHSWVYEKRQREREIRDKALDAALQLWTVYFRIRFAAGQENIAPLLAQMSGLCAALAAYGYPVNSDALVSDSDDRDAADNELARMMAAILSDTK